MSTFGYPPIPEETRATLAQCLRERYDAGATIHTLMRGVGSYTTVRDLLAEARTAFRQEGNSRVCRRYAPRSPEEVIAEMVQGNDCPCALHSKEPWQLLTEYIDERNHHANLRQEERHRDERRADLSGPAARRARREQVAAQCRKRYEAGESLSAIAASGYTSRQTIRRYIVEAGGEIREPLGGDKCERRELAERLQREFNAGATVTQLATPEVGSRKRVIKLLAEVGTDVRLPRRTGKNTDPPSPPPLTPTEAAELFLTAITK